MNKENINRENKICAQERVLILLLIISPIIFYFYLVFPAKSSIEFIGVKVTSYWHKDLEIMFWVLFIKGNLILLLSLWFFYNNEWWRYTILPFLCYTIFQLASSLNEDLNVYPIFEPFYSIYFLIIFIPIYLIMDKYINYKPLTFNDKIEELTEDTLIKLVRFDKNKYTDLKMELETLRSDKHQLSQKEYLLKLMLIQKGIEEK